MGARANGRDIRLGLLVLLAVGVLLTIRAHAAVQAVLETKSEMERPAGAAGLVRTLLEQLAAKDSLLARAMALPSARDPFRPPPSSRVERPAPKPEQPPEAPAPVVRLILFDHTNPIAVLSVGSATSERLQQGDRFQGWEIVAIHSGYVTVSRNGETLVLSSP